MLKIRDQKALSSSGLVVTRRVCSFLADVALRGNIVKNFTADNTMVSEILLTNKERTMLRKQSVREGIQFMACLMVELFIVGKYEMHFVGLSGCCFPDI